MLPSIDSARALLVVIDLQARLVPAIAGSEAIVANASRLLKGAAILDVPALITEQNPAGLGGTVPELAGPETFEKMEFDVTRSPGFLDRAPVGADVVLAGCEAHICVLQTALGLLAAGRRVRVVADAVGSRRTESHDAALARLVAQGADVVTTEMVLFEWLGSAAHPRFRDVVRLVK